MSDSVMLWLAIALLIFWAMGAYNRLVRLRSRSIAAFAALEGLLSQYVAMVKANSLESDLDDGAAALAWTGLTAAIEQFHASLKVARTQPLNGLVMRALKTALETLYLSWARMRELPPDLAGPALPGALQAQWEQVAVQVEVARSEFSGRIENYNEAIHQFPALLLAWVFGFKSAQPM